MAILGHQRAALRERRLERARETPLVLSSGLTVHGAATAFERRFEHFIGDYFRPGGVEVRPSMTVLDIGANIGLFSLEVLRRCDGDARIIAAEPAPDTFSYLSRNIRDLFPDAAVQAVRKAVADEPGSATLYYRPSQSGRSSLVTQWPPLADESRLEASLREPPPEYRDQIPAWFAHLPHGVAKALLKQGHRLALDDVVPMRCEVTTVSEIVSEYGLERIDYMKVDVEGAELDVLRGVAAEDWPRIMRIGAEVHDIDGRLGTIGEMLAEVGFDDVSVTQDWPFEGTNVYMIHASRSRHGRTVPPSLGNSPTP